VRALSHGSGVSTGDDWPHGALWRSRSHAGEVLAREGTMPSCPECDAAVSVGTDAVKGEVVACPDCGAELEVRETASLTLALAPEAQEDWGE